MLLYHLVRRTDVKIVLNAVKASKLGTNKAYNIKIKISGGGIL